LILYIALWGNPSMWAEKYAYVNQVLLDSYATFIVYKGKAGNVAIAEKSKN
jgi:hypothetical protein